MAAEKTAPETVLPAFLTFRMTGIQGWQMASTTDATQALQNLLTEITVVRQGYRGTARELRDAEVTCREYQALLQLKTPTAPLTDDQLKEMVEYQNDVVRQWQQACGEYARLVRSIYLRLGLVNVGIDCQCPILLALGNSWHWVKAFDWDSADAELVGVQSAIMRLLKTSESKPTEQPASGASGGAVEALQVERDRLAKIEADKQAELDRQRVECDRLAKIEADKQAELDRQQVERDRLAKIEAERIADDAEAKRFAEEAALGSEPPLKETLLRVLRALKELNALCPKTRKKRADVAIQIDGEWDGTLIADEFSELSRKGLIDTLKNRPPKGFPGGAYITQLGLDCIVTNPTKAIKKGIRKGN